MPVITTMYTGRIEVLRHRCECMRDVSDWGVYHYHNGLRGAGGGGGGGVEYDVTIVQRGNSLSEY